MMDGSLQKLLTVIMPSKSRDLEYAAHSDVEGYLHKLGRLNFDQVLSEPAQLNDDSKIIMENTHELAFTNYKTFVNTADCSKAIMNDFRSSRKSLDVILEAMPKFIHELEKFVDISKDVSLNKSKNSNVQVQSDKLIDILELPRLMQHVLHNGDYESAIDLFTYISSRSRKFCNISITQSIKSEIIMMWFETLYHLFKQLRYDLPLSQSLQILGYLRRANTVFESTVDESDNNIELSTNFKTKENIVRVEDGLHLNFLKSRQAWFENLLLDAMNDESSKHLRKLVELHRLHLFNIVTQHKAIFLSENQVSKTKEDDLNGISSLSTWLNEKMQKLSQLVQQDAPMEDEAEFESLLNQCTYLGLSFSRVGADTRCITAPLFSNLIIDGTKSSLKKINTQFENEMKSFKLVFRKIPPKSANNEHKMQNLPPESLLEFYPLGDYCNGLLNVLNSIRVIAPICLALDIFNLYNESLERATQEIVAYYRRQNRTASANERKYLEQFCNAYTDDLIPYVDKCINRAFPPMVIAEQLGVSLSILREEKILFIDQAQICSPILSMMELVT